VLSHPCDRNKSQRWGTADLCESKNEKPVAEAVFIGGLFQEPEGPLLSPSKNLLLLSLAWKSCREAYDSERKSPVR
jgi:hypothetical protein